MWSATVALSLLLSGCVFGSPSESCGVGAACIPTIEWRGTTYYAVGSRGTVIPDGSTTPVGELAAPPSGGANSIVLALDGVAPAAAVAVQAAPDYEVAPGISVPYLLFVRDGDFPTDLCQYYVADPEGDPAPPALPDACR